MYFVLLSVKVVARPFLETAKIVQNPPAYVDSNVGYMQVFDGVKQTLHACERQHNSAWRAHAHTYNVDLACSFGIK